MHDGILKKIITKLSNACLGFSVGMIMASHPEWNPRVWSNRELRKLGPIFKGNMLNVSAIKDEDKEGGKYSDYFPNVKSYTITNFDRERGSSGMNNEKPLDLSRPYDGSIGTFDVVMSHTVLEHVYPFSVSIQNLCSLSKDVIIIVSPFIQGMHGEDGFYYDYYRFTPLALKNSLEEYGFLTIYSNWNEDHPLLNVYLIHVASRFPKKYEDDIPSSRNVRIGYDFPGLLYTRLLWPSTGKENITFFRRLGERIGQTVKMR